MQTSSKLTRINKRLVDLGLADSRRKADQQIIAGKVTVNGKVSAELGQMVADTDLIKLNGKSGSAKSDIYIVYFKPHGEICSHLQQGSSPTIFQTLPKSFANLKIAGRLDKDSAGLVVLSSDGEFVQSLSHPTKLKLKTYLVELRDPLSSQNISRLRAGIKLEDGISKFEKFTSLTPKRLRLALSEGRNRQIRRTFDAIGNKIVSLERISIGSYTNHGLKPGQFVFVKPEDII